MATQQRTAANPPYSRERSYTDTTAPDGVSSSEYLDLLGDEYARRILSALVDEPMTGRELIDTTGISKPTVYRRLGRLEEVGLVASEQKLDLDGHHCKRFRSVVEGIDFEFGENGICVSLDTDSQSDERASPLALADD